MENENQINLKKLEELQKKTVFVISYITPFFILSMIPILTLTIFFSIMFMVVWAVGFFSLYFLMYYFDEKKKKLTYKCWYPEQMFRSSITAFYINFLAMDLTALLFVIFFYLSFKPPLFAYIQIGIYMIVLNLLFPVFRYAKKKHYDNSESIVKHFKFKIEKLEPVVERILNESRMKFEKIQNRSKWKPHNTLYNLENKIEIEIFGGAGYGIRIEPVRSDDKDFLQRFQETVDRYISLMGLES
jgi:hypothetical protein